MTQTLKEKLRRGLKWSERYTKTDMLYLTKGGFWLGLGHFIQIGSGLIMAVAFANLLPQIAYGTYQFVMAIAAVLSALTLSGMGTAIKRAVAQGNHGALPYGFRIQMMWNVAIAIAGGALSLYYFVNDNTTLASAFLIVGALAPFVEGFSLYRAHLIGAGKFKENTTLGLWRKPIVIVSVISALFVTDDPVTLVAVYFVSNVLSVALLYRLVVRTYALSPRPDSGITRYSAHLSIIGIVGTIGSHIDKILIFHLLGAAPVALYTLALLPLTHAQKSFNLLKELVFPRFAQREYAVIRSMMRHKILLLLIPTGGLVLLYAAIAPILYNTLFPYYTDAVLYSQILMLALLVKPFSLFDQTYAAHGLKKVQYFLSISVTIVKIISLYILISMFGVWGAVYSILGTHLYWVIATTLIFYLRRH